MINVPPDSQFSVLSCPYPLPEIGIKLFIQYLLCGWIQHNVKGNGISLKYISLKYIISTDLGLTVAKVIRILQGMQPRVGGLRRFWPCIKWILNTISQLNIIYKLHVKDEIIRLQTQTAVLFNLVQPFWPWWQGKT